jgi:uncharacterized protein (UPF0210 family)
MKIRVITLGLTLTQSDFNGDEKVSPVQAKIKEASATLKAVRKCLQDAGYEVKGMKLALNSLEDWLPNGGDGASGASGSIDSDTAMDLLRRLDSILNDNDILSCSLGNCSNISSLAVIPRILALSHRFCCSFQILQAGKGQPPEFLTCSAVAECILNIGRNSSACVSNSFSFCGAFNVSSDSPLGPAAFHEGSKPSALSIGLENSDLLFLAFYAAESSEEASDNLQACLRQALAPLQPLAAAACAAAGVEYAGVDLSINPGVTPAESSVAQIELLKPNYFGADGTMSSLAIISSALESVAKDDNLKTCGYCGVCLPVVIDAQLATRAAESPPAFSARDLVAYTAVSGFGLDAVPIAGGAGAGPVAALLMDVGALSYRLNKPMMCR